MQIYTKSEKQINNLNQRKMEIIHGHSVVKFLELTVKELTEVVEQKEKIENRGYSLEDDFQTWENCYKDITRLKKDLEEIGLKVYYTPIQTADKRVLLMRYCNNNLSYGIGIENDKITYYLCTSPTLSAIIQNVISTHDTPEEMQDAFYQQRNS